MLQSRLDHIVLAAPSLAEGAEYIHRCLGVTLETGGEHPLMGTHNLLLRLGTDIYLEVIAIDYEAQAPETPRWFGLDDLGDQPTRLVTWVAATNDIKQAQAKSRIDLGEAQVMYRGDLKWTITIPTDGQPPINGTAPALIQWEDTAAPAGRLDDIGCHLVELEIFHPEPERIRELLDNIGFEGPLKLSAIDPSETPYLVAHIDTPTGLRQLSSLASD